MPSFRHRRLARPHPVWPFLFALFTAATAGAVPASPELRSLQQPDGTTVHHLRKQRTSEGL